MITKVNTSSCIHYSIHNLTSRAVVQDHMHAWIYQEIGQQLRRNGIALCILGKCQSLSLHYIITSHYITKCQGLSLHLITLHYITSHACTCAQHLDIRRLTSEAQMKSNGIALHIGKMSRLHLI